jgi:large subunit ribosomal protein L10
MHARGFYMNGGGEKRMPSESTLQRKKEMVKELSERIRSAKAMVLADYRGLTVQQDTELRSALRKAGIDYRVVKNTLTKFAVEESNLEGLVPFLDGPTSMALSTEDPVAPAKVLSEYARKFEKLELKAGVVEGRIIDINGIKALAELPPKEVLVARALGGIKSPLVGLVNVLNGNIRGLVVALNAIAEKKAAAG